MAIGTASDDNTTISGLWQLQHPSIWSVRPDTSCICNGQTPGASHVEQTAIVQCKRHGDGTLCHTMCCEGISWSCTLADNRELQELCYAVILHLVHSNWGTHKSDLEWSMLKQWPRFMITRPNWYQVQVHVDKIKSHCIQPATDNVAERCDSHRFEFDTEHLEFIDYLLADNNNYFAIAEHVEGDVRGPNPMQIESNAANKWPEFTSLPPRRYPRVNQC